ncbi:MAG: hypothetical protein WDN66_00610 [Candidatus Saccharibacteria bacterium]
MDLDDSEKAEQDLVVVMAQSPNIWSIDEESEGDSDKDDSSDHDHQSESANDEPIVSSSIEEDLEKPSFLRRLSKRRKDSDSDS